MRYLLFFLISIITCPAFSQNVTQTNNGIKTIVDGLNVEIQFYDSQIVRIVKSPVGFEYKKESLSVIKNPEAVKVDIVQQNNAVIIKSDALIVELDLQTGKVSYRNTTGKSLLTEKDYGTQFTPVVDVKNKTFNVRQAFRLDKDEIIYGLGQQQNGKLSQRNEKIYLRQENRIVCIPFLQSIKGYAVFWDNYSATTYADNEHETSFDSEIGDCCDYYFMYGGNADGVIAKMRELTGQSPMMPLWVYGYNQSKERYKSQFELLEVVKKYRSLKMPIDGIVQDWQYWGKDSNWNAMSFDPVTYPRPKEMVDSIHQLNAHLFIVSWPGFGPYTKQYKELKEKKWMLSFDTWPLHNGVMIYDAYNPKARDIYWRYLNAGIFSFDTDAWWLDSSEPDHFNIKDKDFDLPTYLGSYRSVVNAFPLQHVGGGYDHQRQTTSAKRVSILTRSAFAGQQRYGANTWSGDVHSTWQDLRRQIAAALNFSICGIPYWNADIGGFFAGQFVKGGGAKNPDFQELYTRWLQFATFTPMMRSHGTDVPREIYQFGQRGDLSFDVLEKYINLRYHLLPYVYATAWNVTNHSGTFMRALCFDFPSDKQVVNIDNEFLFGKSFLVAPVTDKGVKAQPVYLPSGTTWYDFWTGETIEGGKNVNKETPMEIMPLYVKAGSIIPWGPTVQYAQEKKWDNLEIRIYPGSDGDFTLYEDENDSYNYEKGLYSEINFYWNDKTHTLTISDRKGNFTGMLTNRKFNIILVNSKNAIGPEPSVKFNKTVTYKGKKLDVKL